VKTSPPATSLEAIATLSDNDLDSEPTLGDETAGVDKESLNPGPEMNSLTDTDQGIKPLAVAEEILSDPVLQPIGQLAATDQDLTRDMPGFSPSEQQVLEMPANYYTKQLFGSYEESRVQALIDGIGNDPSAFYVETRHEDKPWFVLLYGNYPTVSEAQSAQLPPDFQAFSPWIRKWSGLQSALKQRSEEDL